MATIYKSVEVIGEAADLQKNLTALTDDGWTYTDMIPLKFCQQPTVLPRGVNENFIERTFTCFMLIMQKTV